MTASRTRKSTAKKAETETAKAPEPMDDSVAEASTPVAHANRQRECYALSTLVAEVAALDGTAATVTTVTDYDRFNAALTVSFDGLPEPVQTALVLTQADDRVASVRVDLDSEATVVTFKATATLKDSREPFGLADAYAILSSEGPEGIER